VKISVEGLANIRRLMIHPHTTLPDMSGIILVGSKHISDTLYDTYGVCMNTFHNDHSQNHNIWKQKWFSGEVGE